MGPSASCVCGHDHEAHEHYRRGTDCSRCDCPRFRGPSPLRAVAGVAARLVRRR